MKYDELEKLIEDISNNADVAQLIQEIEKIIEGQESKAKLLAFLPIIAKIIYNAIDKDGSEKEYFEMGEQLLQLIIKAVEKKNQ